MAAHKAGLGKGLGALIPESVEQELLLERGEKVQQLSLKVIKPNPAQPRTVFDDVSLKELAASIKRYGIVQPLVVTPDKGSYRIVAGERRWRAAGLAGLQTVPAIVRTLRQLEELEIALVENVQRVDLTPLEQAASMMTLHEQFNLTYDDIAKRLGKAGSTVSNMVRLLQLPKFAKEALQKGLISEGHARQVLALVGNEPKQQELILLIEKHGWTVRQAERFVVSVKEGLAVTDAVKARVSKETPETKRLARQLGVSVSVRRMAKGGRLEISFSSDDELRQIISRIQ